MYFQISTVSHFGTIVQKSRNVFVNEFTKMESLIVFLKSYFQLEIYVLPYWFSFEKEE
jgi:hypothetical protein